MTEEQFAALTEAQAQLMVVQMVTGKLDIMVKSAARAEVSRLLQGMDTKRLEHYGFKVFSQNDEDGIIQEIFRRIGTTNRTFFEFGCGNGLESNCAYLLLQGWSGAWIDGNGDYLATLLRKFKPLLDTTAKLKVQKELITAENINQIAKSLELPEELDLLSIDIDGNDYYVWEALTVLRPRVVVIEYNASFPPPAKLVQAYKADGTWNGTNYFGASLAALNELAGLKKGYRLVGTNLCGVNAFFVRADCVTRNMMWPGEGYLFNPPRFDLGALGYPTGHPPDIGPMR